ncbi:methyltransferase NSUN6 [Trichuris trichiura]|uniref:Methyltransferase NSUN6 n=1 Tax=Trichuris trichiura TaxID=36087 RepID=A0A077ZLD4_TRITR|nr:methyltransferase NSUN6 [Trichuris trichiura]
MPSSNCSCIMKVPPLYSTIRVHTLKLNMMEAKKRMEEILAKAYETRDHMVPVVSFHDKLKDVLVISGSGPFELEKQPVEVYVDSKCGKSVLRGADVYPRGIIGSSKSFYKGQNVSVFVDLDRSCRLGWKKLCPGRKMFVGNGVCGVNRSDIFCAPQKLKICDSPGVRMTACVWNQPKLYGLIEDWGFPQNLPSILCGHVLSPQPGECILDLCSAPGGKSTHIACLMGDEGRVISVDDSLNRVTQLHQNIKKLSLKCVEVFRANVLLKPNGVLVYSTCTLNVAENEGLVNWALMEYPELTLVEQATYTG